MAKNFISVLKMAETLTDAPSEGFAKSEVVEKSGLPTSTAYRLIVDLEEAGLIYRTRLGRYLPNFSFEPRIALGTISPQKLRAACSRISEALEAASEVIVHRGHNLLWHLTEEHPSRAIKLRAHPGYVRSTYELDSISRTVLSYCGIETIERTWDLSNFHDVGVNGARVTWDEARARILGTAPEEVHYDMLGNAKGVRRFCVAITDGNGQFVCLLTVAEAATPLRDETAHIEQIREALLGAKKELETNERSEGKASGLKFG